MNHLRESAEVLPVVIVADDEPVIRMLATDVLSDAGFRVFEAVNSDEALKLLDARPDAAALVTDVEMAGSMNGFALARLVAVKHPHVGIVIASGRALPGEDDLPAGALFLQKPYAPSGLVGAVRQVVPAADPGIVVADAISTSGIAVKVVALEADDVESGGAVAKPALDSEPG